MSDVRSDDRLIYAEDVRKLRRRPPMPMLWPSRLSERFPPWHFEDVEDFLTSDPVTPDELRRMAIASGGAQSARARGIDRK